MDGVLAFMRQHDTALTRLEDCVLDCAATWRKDGHGCGCGSAAESSFSHIEERTRILMSPVKYALIMMGWLTLAGVSAGQTRLDQCEAVRPILASVRKAQLKIEGGSRLDYKQLDQILITMNGELERTLSDLRLREQSGEAKGSNQALQDCWDLQLKFNEIFPVTDDEVLIPVTQTLASLAPASTFTGLTAYGRHHEVKARIIAKRLEMCCNSNLLPSLITSKPYYKPYFQTDRGHAYPYKNEILLRWADVKDKIAYDLSENKAQEDLQLKLTSQ
jgi:hypothetical protein